MKNIFSRWNKHGCLVLIMIFFTLMPINVSAQSESEATLLFLGNHNLPPMVYIENGTPKGLVVDIVYALEEKMGKDIEIEAMNWSEAQAIVAQGEADALIQINETEERKKIFDFSEPLLESEFSIFTLTDTTGISGIADISGLRVGVEDKGFPSVVLQTNPLINLVSAPSLQAAFEMLKERNVDVVIADKRVGAYILANQKINDVRIVGEPIAKLNSSIAVKKGNTELLAEINKGISEIKEDGTYQKILDKWQPKEVVYLTQDEIRINQYETAFSVLLLLLLVSIVWGILLFRQLAKRKKAEDAILYLSYYDYLTEIYNRRFYEEELKRLDCQRNLPLTLIMGDVNGLKKINDTFGHSQGDILLKKVAELIKKGCRSGDIVARYGGDEFVIILPSTAKVEAERIIERINNFAKEEKVGDANVSIAFGFATKESEGENIQDVLKKAETNMYREKWDKSNLS